MNTTIGRRFARCIALPAVTAGIIGGAALGLAGTATAQTTTTETNGSTAIVSTPDHYANPAPSAPGWHNHHHHRYLFNQ
jgi:hypothetical protein